jgi:DNA modification methylase
VTPVGYLETGVIYCGDNLARLAEFPTDSVDLIYLDPPFFSNRHYEVIWGDEAEVRSFEDRWSGGIEVYIDWMRERVMEIRRVLKETGSVYLHCDWHASHYLKVMMDEVFGSGAFRNEIIWAYRGGGVSKRWWARKHDVILFYTKGKVWTFNPQFTPYSESTMEVAKGGKRVNKTAIDLKRGGHMPDWWTDINALQTWSPERLGYPTQKPVALLERIIKTSSNPGDVVLDPFCGCGTTLRAAQNLGREWIGLDISPTACGVMQRQLARIGQAVKIVGLPMTVDDLRALRPFEFQNWVIGRINGTHSPRNVGDFGIDGHTFFTHDPVQVKQSEGIGRNVVDNFETAIKRDRRQKGYIVALSFGRGAREEVARAKSHEGLDIELIEVRALLDGSHPLAQSESTIFGTEIAPIVPRDVATLPTVEELMGGQEPLARAAEEPADYGDSSDSN